MKKKGICIKQRIVYGVVTVSKKGQIAIPVDARRDLGIQTGERRRWEKRNILARTVSRKHLTDYWIISNIIKLKK